MKYYAFQNYPHLNFTDTSVIYVLSNYDTTASNDSLFRVDMKFVNGNTDQKIRPLDQCDDYCNFFYDHAERSNVPNYSQLISFNVWNGVDVIYGSNRAGFKYYFVCKPVGGGSSAGQVSFHFEGADSVRIDGSGQLIVYTAFGSIVHPRAHVWQLDASGNFSSLAWQPNYTLTGTDTVRFTNFGSYTTSLPLIISVDWGDGVYPSASTGNLLYSAWYGTGQGEIYRDIKVGHDLMVNVCGQTSSYTFPHLSAIQTTFYGGRDAIVVQYYPNGARKWATYYGGSGFDIAHGIDLDVTGNIYIVGETTTAPATPTDHPFYQTSGVAFVDSTLNNSSNTFRDGFIVKLSWDGQNRQWASYLGGSGDDVAYTIAISETNGNIWVGGEGDTTGFPLDPADYFTSTHGGGMLWRFQSVGVVIYSVFIGPTNNTATIQAIVVDSVGDAVAAGMTGSGFPVTNGCAQFNYGAAQEMVFWLNSREKERNRWSGQRTMEVKMAMQSTELM